MFSGLSSLFYDDPSNSMGNMPNDVSNTISPYYQPYMDAGLSSMGTLQEQLARMYGDPGALYADLGKGFKESPGYEYNVQQATGAANRAAAAGGQLGSPAEQLALSKQVSGMADQDYDNYMKSMMGIYGGGIQGLTGLTQLGYGASSSMANDMANAMMGQYGMQMAGQNAQNQGFNSLLGTAGGLVGSASWW